ncbi:hypothetical protein GALL_334210 [mine drainage metagenome]|uniref:Membrane transporter protein n=1 Tax=mine drainage metagenome TaxID=410659 RepID=A0A1J5QY21_9ZZZZ
MNFAFFSLLIGIGLTAGMASGLFGIGGGILIIPALVYWAGFTQHQATGTSLAILLPPVGLAAVLEYYRHGAVDIQSGLIVAAGLFVGGGLGAVLANHISGPHLKLSFGIFILFIGTYMIFTSLIGNSKI